MGYYDNLMNQQMMNGGFQNGYNYPNGYYQRVMQSPQVQQMQPQQQNISMNIPQLPPQEVLKVNGKNGIDMLNMSPNSSLLALDINKPIVWFVQTDGAGYKTPLPYKIIPYTEEEDNSDSKVMQAIYNLDSRISTLEGMVNNATYGQQSDSEYDATGYGSEHTVQPAESAKSTCSTKSTKSKRSNDADV